MYFHSSPLILCENELFKLKCSLLVLTVAYAYLTENKSFYRKNVGKNLY